MTPCRPALLALLGCLLASAATAQDQSRQRVAVHDREGREVAWYGDSYALVIGVSKYTAGWPNLKNVSKDLRAVRKKLQAHGFEIVKAPANPTKKILSSTFQEFFSTYGNDPHNRLLVFFSGHGYTFEGKDRGFLVPSDAPDPLADKVGFLRKAVHMNRVMTWSRRIDATHVLFVFDSSFSDAALKAAAVSDPPSEIGAATARPVRQFVSAGGAGGQKPEKSTFAPGFARAMLGEADLNGDRQVTGTELGVFLHQAASTAGQTPRYGKIFDPDLNQGEFVFRVPEKKKARRQRP